MLEANHYKFHIKMYSKLNDEKYLIREFIFHQQRKMNSRISKNIMWLLFNEQVCSLKMNLRAVGIRSPLEPTAFSIFL